MHQPAHHKAQNGWVFEHVLVMERQLGRVLQPNETVVRKNGNKADNRIENLLLRDGTHKAPRELTKTEETELRRMYTDGVRFHKIARHFAVSEKLLRSWCLAIGLHRKSFKELAPQMIELRKAGRTMREIGEIFGCTGTTVYNHTRKVK